MQPKLLELQFSQLQSEWSKAKYNNYSDLRKKEYHTKLATIISALEKENFQLYDDTEITQRFHIISFLFKSLEFLNNSTTSTIPFEIVYVLSEALKDWSSTEDYIIVTSLINDMNGFSFDNSLMFNDFIYKDIELLYGVNFDKRLVQINLPLSLSRDYLANVVLYHELGHFVDRKYEITRVIYIEILDSLISGKLNSDEKEEIFKYFPYLADHNTVAWLKGNYNHFNYFSNHIAEYFCDLFASQYIKDCSNQYLDYITLNQKNYSGTHPSTTNRIDFVEVFLKGTPSFLIDRYKDIIFKITDVNVEIREKEIDSKNFESLIPVEIQERKELHGLFTYGWKVWLDNWNNIKSQSNIGFDLSQVKVYEILNNLIEKSIGNFIVQTEWELAKKS